MCEEGDRLILDELTETKDWVNFRRMKFLSARWENTFKFHNWINDMTVDQTTFALSSKYSFELSPHSKGWENTFTIHNWIYNMAIKILSL